jgi:hypothetical protein
MVVNGRQAAKTWALLGVVAAIALVVAVVVAREGLFGLGPNAIHDPASLADRIHVCGRDYKDPALMSRADWPSDAPFVLVDPAPLARCAPIVDDPAGVCASGQIVCATFTIVFVRVGPDAYVRYALVGGP